jgi:S-DNA-T family DNA segregation ATPase FtsK/SpoIIIE
MPEYRDDKYKQALLQLDALRQSRLKSLDKEFKDLQNRIVDDYNDILSTIQEQKIELNQSFDFQELEWENPKWKNFDPFDLTQIPMYIRVGDLTYQGSYTSLDIPAIVPFFGSGRNILIKAQTSRLKLARSAIQSMTLRLLALTPLGKLRLICIDPVGLGDTVAGLIQELPDTITHGRAWTETSQIEDQLTTLELLIATFKQKLLGKKFPTIEEYNQNAGELDEPYRLLIVSDFPERFSDTAAQRLLNIASNGPSAGVYVLMMLNSDKLPTYYFPIVDLENTSHVITLMNDRSSWQEGKFKDCKLLLDEPPSSESFISLVNVISQGVSKLQRRTIHQNIPDMNQWWRSDASHEFRIPIGMSSTRKVQELIINEEEFPDALVVGKQGYGKSNLLQVIVDTLCINYSPEELELYLIDFKQVTFEVYARYTLPHAPVIAINADREFSVSVLRRIEQEINMRADRFSQVGEDHLSGYRKEAGEIVPRVLLIIDECQELFHDDNLGRESDIIIERIVRLGRAFGIHLMLSSQTLRGSMMMSSVTKDLIPVRIALQCSDTDARSVMSDENNEATLLEFPGQAIYNVRNGLLEGNRTFQVYWLDKELRRNLLKNIRSNAEQRNLSPQNQIIFDGRSQGSISRNVELNKYINSFPNNPKTNIYHGWLGEPIEIKSHTRADFQPGEGKNLIILGGVNKQETVYSLMASCFCSFITQNNKARFSFINFGGWEYGSEFLLKLRNSFPDVTTLIDGQRECELEIKNFENELKKRQKSGEKSATFLFVIGLQSIQKMRKSDDYSLDSKKRTLGDILFDICSLGPQYGLCSIIWCDLLRNLERALGTSALDVFDMRVALQMSVEDSRLLLESENASTLGPYRAIYEDYNRNHIEKFRPYSVNEIEKLMFVITKPGE